MPLPWPSRPRRTHGALAAGTRKPQEKNHPGKRRNSPLVIRYQSLIPNSSEIRQHFLDCLISLSIDGARTGADGGRSIDTA